ncbi:uncharacterized protein METZ01_LOCUS505986 [marine metagenome]|uniref:Uncharacterized protein n=1 Tax=marine metagenome TaxID=408172 RepID=A0A383E8F0_9ZZZZ
MSRIKDDLVCEIIRVSQTNLLASKKAECSGESEDETVMDWIRYNAASYREDFEECLGFYSPAELGDMLSELTQSKKDLSEVLKNYPRHKSKSKVSE